MPARLEDRGAVAAEFALLLPVQLLIIAGMFGMGALMLLKTELTYVVEGAAKVEARARVGDECPLGAQISGQWPVTLGIPPMLTLQAQACWPAGS